MEKWERITDFIASEFHKKYEDLASSYGYETRKESAKPWEDVPAQNKELMRAVVSQLIKDGVIQPGHW